MTTTHPEPHTSRQFQGLILRARPTTGNEEDDDDRDDEQADENEQAEQLDTWEDEGGTIAPRYSLQAVAGVMVTHCLPATPGALGNYPAHGH